MAPMRILHLVTRSHRRGAELAALDLARELDALGHQNRMLSLGCAFDGSSLPDIPVLSASSSLRATTAVPLVRRLRRVLADAPVDIVFAHGGLPAQTAAFARKHGAPLVVWQRILPFPPSIWRPGRRHFWQAVTRRIDAAVALTDDDRNELRRLGFTKTVRVIPNFRRLSRFAQVDHQQATTLLRDSLAVGGDVRLLGLVGHLIAQKQPERALEVLRGVRERGIDAHLVVAGDGPLRPAFLEKCEREGLTPFTHMLGTVSDVESVLGALDALLLTSDTEGIPGIVIEAQMCALPVVTFDIGGVATVVLNNVTGAIVAPRDVAAMTQRTTALLQDEAGIERMREAAREHAARFATERVARDYSNLLSELDTLRCSPSFGESGQMARAKSADL